MGIGDLGVGGEDGPWKRGLGPTCRCDNWKGMSQVQSGTVSATPHVFSGRNNEKSTVGDELRVTVAECVPCIHQRSTWVNEILNTTGKFGDTDIKIGYVRGKASELIVESKSCDVGRGMEAKDSLRE